MYFMKGEFKAKKAIQDAIGLADNFLILNTD